MKLKRILLTVFALTLMLCALFVTASAAEIVDSGDCGAQGSNVTWTLDGDGVLTISGTGDMGEFVQEEEDDWYYFTPWDIYWDNIRTIIIQEGVTSVSWGAFRKAGNVTEIYLPTTLKSIGPEAFGNEKDVTVYITNLEAFLRIDLDISLSGWGAGTWMQPNDSPMNHASLVLNGTPVTTLVIPEGITSISPGMFYGSKGIDTVYFPASLNGIGSYAFGNSSVKNIYFSGDEIYFGNYAFSTSLENVYVDSLDNWLTYEFDITYCGGGDGEGDEPSLSSNPLYNCENFYVGDTLLTALLIPEGTIRIPEGAFVGYEGLQKVWIPGSVTDIGGAAFVDCDGISKVNFAGNCPAADYVFLACAAFCDDENCDECKRWDAFTNVAATAYYPANDPTWTAEAKRAFGGKLDWREEVTLEITTQPKTAYAKLGEKAKLTVKAEGDGLTYQWYVKDVGDSKYFLSSIDTPTYSMKMTEANHGRRAYCVITDAYGNSVKTKTVYLRVAASVKTQPKNTYTQKDATAKVKIEAVGDELTYQWYIKNAGAKKYSKSSVTSATYSCKMTDKAKDRYAYCIVTDKYGNTEKTKTVVLRMAATITTQPKTAYAKLGEKAKITVKAVGDELTYQWYVKDVGDSKYFLSSIDTPTYSMKMKESNHGRRAYCVITDAYGNSVKTKTVYLRVAASIKTQPKSVTVAEGKTAKVILEAVGDELTYQWYIKNEGASKFSKSSVTKATYSCKMSEKADGRQVYCVVTDKYGKTVKSNTVTLKMK